MSEKFVNKAADRPIWDRLLAVTDLRAAVTDNIKPETAEHLLMYAQEKARLPLSPDERVRATRVLELDQEQAIAAFKVKAESQSMHVGCRLDDSNTLNDMEATKEAIVRLRVIYEGKEESEQEKGEPIDVFLNTMIAECATHIEFRHKGELISVNNSLGSLLHLYVRMRRIHEGLSGNPAAARATILGKAVPIVGADDPTYRDGMLLRKTTYGSIADELRTKLSAA